MTVGSVHSEPKILLFLDVLGFSNVYRRLGHHAMLALYERLLTFVDSQEGGLAVVDLPDGTVAVGHFHAEHAYFSDTILFWRRFGEIDLRLMTELAAETVCQALEIGLPVRGSIAIGEGIFDNSRRRYIGETLIEAAAAEKAQAWIGVSFGHSIYQSNFGRCLYPHTILPYKSHVKPDADRAVSGVVVDWPRRWRESRSKNLRAVLMDLNADGAPGEYYTNTARFLRFSEMNHDWFKRTTHLGFG